MMIDSEETLRARLLWVKMYQQNGDAGLTCRRCGISRPTLRKWTRRYQEAGAEGLKSQSWRRKIPQVTTMTPISRERESEHEQILLGDPPRAHMMLLYPFIGSGSFRMDATTAWNGSMLYLVPVRVHHTLDLNNALPPIEQYVQREIDINY